MKIELHPHIKFESNEISAIEKTMEILRTIERECDNNTALPEDFYKEASEAEAALNEFFWKYC